MLNLRRLITRYHTLTPQQYLLNQKQSSFATKPQSKILQPLPNSNHGSEQTSDSITLVGIPKGTFKEQFEQYDTLQRNLVRNPSDLIFLDIDPSQYLVRQRFASHKCALNQVQDYYKDGIVDMDPIKPLSWQETVVNLITLDMIRQNKIPDQLDYRRGFYAYNYNYVQDQNVHKDLTLPMTNAISEHVLGGKRTGNTFLDKVLYTGLMGGHKIMLGGMPESLHKLVLGNSVTIHQLRDMFKFVLAKNNELTAPTSIEQACTNFLPHIFQTPKDLYLTAILKQAFQAALQITAFVSVQHWSPIQSYWVDAPKGINFYEATSIPDRMQGQTDEQLVEKQAILQVLLSTRTWGRPFISNPFPYISEDVTKFSDDDLLKLKSTFQKYYLMYKSFKEKEVKKVDDGNKPKIQRLMRNFQDVQKDIPNDPKFKQFGNRIVKKQIEVNSRDQ